MSKIWTMVQRIKGKGSKTRIHRLTHLNAIDKNSISDFDHLLANIVSMAGFLFPRHEQLPTVYCYYILKGIMGEFMQLNFEWNMLHWFSFSFIFRL